MADQVDLGGDDILRSIYESGKTAIRINIVGNMTAAPNAIADLQGSEVERNVYETSQTAIRVNLV